MASPTPVQVQIQNNGDLFGLGTNGLNPNVLSANWSTNSQLNLDVTPTNNVVPGNNSNNAPTIVIPANSLGLTPYQGPTVSAATNPQPNPSEIATGQNSSLYQTPVAQQTQTDGSSPTSTPLSQTATSINNSGNTTSVSQLLNAAIQPNPLNNFWQPAYHFRLFAAKDADILTQSNNTLSQITGRKTPQVTIAETGVTGFNISEVTINTVGPGNSSNLEMPGTELTIVVVEPQGVSFPDGLLGASTLLQNNNSNKSPYYLELSFTGYNESNGTYAGRPINVLASYPNGGYWLWGITITNIETKLNEGSAVYTITATILSSGSLSNQIIANLQVVPQTITVTGNTVKAIYQDFVTKVNKAWVDNYSQGGNESYPLATYGPIKTHPIVVGPAAVIGKDPGDFVLTPSAPDQSSIRSYSFGETDGVTTCHIPAGTMVRDFLGDVLKNCEQYQNLVKDLAITGALDQSATQVNSKGFRETLIFATEFDQQLIGYDPKHENYRWQINVHLVPHYTQEPVASPVQKDNAKSASTQAAMIQSLVQNGFVKKRYDYIFTGKNTEVLDLDLSWNMAWQALIPRLSGARFSIDNEATHARTNPASINSSPDGSVKLTDQYLVTTNDAAPSSVNNQSTFQPGVTGSPGLYVSPGQLSFSPPGSVTIPSLVSAGPNSNAVSQATQSLLSQSSLTNSATNQMFIQLQSTNASTTPLGSNAPTTTPKTATPVAPTTQVNTNSGNNIYIEDVLNSLNQNQTLNIPSPISLWSGFMNTAKQSGANMNTQYHPGQSFMGAFFEQINSGTPYNNDGKFQSLEMTIRGDPFWLGQTNLERDVVLRTGKPTYDPAGLPDWVSGNQAIYLYFRYPLQTGDNFTPVLNDSVAFNGLYYVTSAVHNFSEGMFKQTLTCLRIPLITNMAQALSATPSANNTSDSGASSNPGAANTTPGSTASGTVPTMNTSQPGVSLGDSANNPQNLRFPNTALGAVGVTSGGFGVYDSAESGIAAGYNQLLIDQNIHGLQTPSQIIGDPVHGWAPAADSNNPVAYTNGIQAATGFAPDEPVNLNDQATAVSFIQAQIKQEGNTVPDVSVIQAGVARGAAYYKSQHP